MFSMKIHIIIILGFILGFDCCRLVGQSIDGQFKSYSRVFKERKKKHQFSRSYPKMCNVKANRVLRYSKAQQKKRRLGLKTNFTWGIEAAFKYIAPNQPSAYAGNMLLGWRYLKSIIGVNLGYDTDYSLGQRFSLQIDYRYSLSVFPFESFIGFQNGLNFSNFNFENRGYVGEIRWGPQYTIFIMSIGLQYTLSTQSINPAWIDRSPREIYNYTAVQFIGVLRLGIQL